MGSRPLRMKVRWGCSPRVLSPPPHRTQSWRPCLPGQPWASGWRSPDRPVPSPRGWTILGAGHGSQPRPASVPFFPEVHEELTKSWMAPFTGRSRSSASSILTTLNGGVARGYAGIPQVERAIAVHLCPRNAATWRNRPCLSRPRPVGWQPLSPCTPWLSCRFTKSRRSNRCTRVVPTRGWCRSCARQLTSLYERRKSQCGPSGRQCPPWWSRSAISGSTWQRWRTSTRHAFSTAPSPRQGCLATPSRALPSSSRQYSSRPRRSSTPAPAWCTIHRCPRGQASVCPSPWAPSCVLQSCSAQAESIPRPARRASHRRAAPHASQPGPKSSRKSTKRPWRGQPGDVGICSFSGDGENSAAPSPGGGPGGESSVSVPPSVPLSQERAISFSSGFSGPWDDSVRRPASSLSSTNHYASSQESTVRGRHSSPRTSGQFRLGLREFGEDASERTAFCTIHPYSLSLHHHRYVDCAVGAACTVSGGMAHAAQPVSLAHAHNSTRLRDSVRQATSQVQRHSRVVGGSPERPCLAQGDCCPPGKGCNRAGPSSRDEAGVLQPLLHRTQERWWPSTNPGSASFEPGFTQAPVQDADAQAYYQMHPAPGLVCSDRPEGCLLSCFDPSATQTIPTVCVRRSGMAVQGPPLRALPVSPCVHEGRRRRPYPVTGSGRQDPQLPRRLAYPSPIQRAVGRSQGLGASAPQPVEASGQLGKEQALPCAENLFSRCGVRLGEYDGMPHGGTCPSSAELPEFLQRQECGTTETVFGRESGCQLIGFGRETRTVPPSGGFSWAQVHRDRSLHLGRARLWAAPRSEKPIIQPRGLGTGRSVDLQPDTHGCPGKHGCQLWVRCGGGDITQGGQPHRTFILRGREPIPRCCDRHPIYGWHTEWNAARGTDQRNHPGTGRDFRCVRSKRSVGACPAERLLLSPSDLPERLPVVLCSSQRTEHGWRQRVPILSERKGEIAAKSCSYAHNRRMSHPRKHLQRVGSSDTEDNDRVHHPRTGNDRNQKDTDGTASWKRRDRPWFALLEFALLVEVPRGIAAERDSADCTVTPTRNKKKMKGFVEISTLLIHSAPKQKSNERMHLSPFYTRMHREWLRYAKSTTQFHWRFLLKLEMIGASR